MTSKSSRKKKTITGVLTNLELNEITPKTRNQNKIFKEFTNNNLVIHGYPGTGKTYLTLYLAIKELIENSNIYNNITIIRSVVPSREVGFLPGSLEEKIQIYEYPYESLVNEIFGRDDAYGLLKKNGLINFKSTSFLRGLTEHNTIIIVDEIQNMTFQELDTIVTRVGYNTKIMFLGDYRQTDLKYEKEKSGLHKFLDILKTVKGFSYIEMNQDDILRSNLVKDYIIEKMEYEHDNKNSSS